VPYWSRDQDRRLVPLIGEEGGRLADAVRAHVVTEEHAAAAAAAAVEDAYEGKCNPGDMILEMQAHITFL
jgi:hypothetical protein